MSLIGRVHLVSNLSKVQVSSKYIETEPSSDPVMKKSFYLSISLLLGFKQIRTYRRSDCGIILLAIIDIRRFAIGTSSVDSDNII